MIFLLYFHSCECLTEIGGEIIFMIYIFILWNIFLYENRFKGVIPVDINKAMQTIINYKKKPVLHPSSLKKNRNPFWDDFICIVEKCFCMKYFYELLAGVMKRSQSDFIIF